MCIVKDKHNYAFSDLVEVTNNRTFSVHYFHIDVTMRRSFDFLLRLFSCCSRARQHITFEKISFNQLPTIMLRRNNF